LKKDITVMADPVFASKVEHKLKIFEKRYSGITAILEQTLLSLMPALSSTRIICFY
jgi:hypothetical protein